MADMIEAKDAKARLNCDDAALQGHINSGALRAQRVGGKLMLNAEDVDKLAKDGDDGTIVLTGDSENLSIDLGKVVDDQSATMVKPGQAARKDDSITFGDELEVVSYDDGNTQKLKADTKPTAQAGGLSFTDTNTAVITSVDETQVGATTGVIDTAESAPASQRDLDRANRGGPGSDSSRRSVRSSRLRSEPVAIHWGWLVLMGLTLFVGLVFAAPYYTLGMWAKGDPTAKEGRDAAGNVARGLDDGGYAGMAGGQFFAGFTVEPREKVYQERLKRNQESGQWVPISKGSHQEKQAEWRMDRFIGGDEKDDFSSRTTQLLSDLTATTLSADRTSVTTVSGKSIPVRKEKVRRGDQEVEVLVPVLEPR